MARPASSWRLDTSRRQRRIRANRAHERQDSLLKVALVVTVVLLVTGFLWTLAVQGIEATALCGNDQLMARNHVACREYLGL